MVILRYPNLADEAVLRLAHAELDADGSNFLLDAYKPEDQFSDYIQRVQNSIVGKNMLPGYVRADFYVAVENGEIVGRSSIRHELNDWLFQFGGHIGYAVRPGFRLKGFATQILGLSLQRAKQLGINRVLMTCNDDNLGSIKVIEKHGGELENRVESDGKFLRRYWITVN